MLNKIVKPVFLAFLVTIFSVVSALAIEPITANLEKAQIFLGEVSSVSFTLNEPGLRNFSFPRKTNDYQVVATSSSSNISIINGRTTQSKTYRYVIQALHPGKITIPPATAYKGQNNYSSSPLLLTVLATKPSAQQKQLRNSAGNRRVPAPAPVPAQNIQNNVIARMEVSNASPYVNEQITMRMKIYHRGNLRSLNIPPVKLDNFIQRKDDKAKEYREVYKNREYLVYETDFVLFPVKAGQIKIPSYEIIAMVFQERAFRPRAFDPFRVMNPFMMEKELKLKSNSITLNVRSLPPAPKGFSGYVGDLAVNHTINKYNIKAGEAATISTKIYGSGNPGNVDLDFVKDSKLFTTYQDNKNTSEEINDSRLYFETKNSTAIFPEKAEGRVAVDLQPIISFNPQTRKYEEHGRTKFEITVLANPDREADTNGNIAQQRKPKEAIRKEIIVFSQSQIQAYSKSLLESLKLDTLFVLIILVNLLFVIKLVLIQIKLLPDDREDPANLKEAMKSLKQAESLESISTTIKEITQKHYNIKDPNLENDVNRFISSTDAFNYGMTSDNISGEKLEEFRAKAIEIIKKIKANKELKS